MRSANTGVYYCLGLACNGRLLELIEAKLARVRESAILSGGVARGFTEIQYQTLKSWTRPRRVIAKAEVLQDKDNPRFIVNNLPLNGFEHQPRQTPERFWQAHQALAAFKPEEDSPAIPYYQLTYLLSTVRHWRPRAEPARNWPKSGPGVVHDWRRSLDE